LPNVDAGIWIGLLAPASTPADIVDKLSVAANEALQTEAVKKALDAQGIDPLGGTAAEFAKFIADDIVKWEVVLTEAGLRKQPRTTNGECGGGIEWMNDGTCRPKRTRR
jgi:tripartite-type tricarboxylate transporter receptor subunit TctC